MLRRILHIDLDAFFVSVEQRERHELQGKSVVVVGTAGSRGAIVSASYEARRYGHKSDMSLAKAYRTCGLWIRLFHFPVYLWRTWIA